MDTFINYMLPKLPRPVPFVAPPYCRRAARTGSARKKNSHDDGLRPSLKLMVQSPSKLLLLYESLQSEHSKGLEVTINKYLMKEAKCKLTFLIHIIPEYEEAIVQTMGLEELESPLHVALEKDMVANLVKYENEHLKCGEALDAALMSMFTKISDGARCNIHSVPMLKRGKRYRCATDQIFPRLLVCYINSEENESYLARTTNEVFRYCLPILMQARATEEEERQKNTYYSLLNVIYQLIPKFDDINELLKKMESETKQILRAQKCSLYLSNTDDLRLITNIFNPENIHKVHAKVDHTKNNKLTDRVVTTGKLLNIWKQEHLFENILEQHTGFKTRNLLCFPIKNTTGIIGAVQLCNKIGGDFTHFDEELSNLLGLFYGLSITHSLKYTQNNNKIIRRHMCEELMINYVDLSEAKSLKKMECPLIHKHHNFYDFDFSPREIVQMESVCFVLKMFDELGFFALYSFSKPILTRFVMSIKEGCRDIPYHNWMHLFVTAHFGFLCLKNLQLVESGYISSLEGLALFLACLCHDVDYRGTNNPFQEVPTNSLASLYSSAGSTMERHRLSQFLRILNSEGCNFLDVLSRHEYTLCLSLLKDVMLATDLATHFKFYKKQCRMIKVGYEKNNAEHRYLFSCLLMTCADLVDHTRDCTVDKKIVEQLYEELYTRGDLQMNSGLEIINMELKTGPMLMPDFELKFLYEVCLPAFKLLAAMFPDLKKLVSMIKRNIMYWEATRLLGEGPDPKKLLNEI